MADSGVDSGLDKVADLLGAGGREAPVMGDPEFDAGLMPGVSCRRQLSVAGNFCPRRWMMGGALMRVRRRGASGTRSHAERWSEGGREFYL